MYIINLKGGKENKEEGNNDENNEENNEENNDGNNDENNNGNNSGNNSRNNYESNNKKKNIEKAEKKINKNKTFKKNIINNKKNIVNNKKNIAEVINKNNLSKLFSKPIINKKNMTKLVDKKNTIKTKLDTKKKLTNELITLQNQKIKHITNKQQIKKKHYLYASIENKKKIALINSEIKTYNKNKMNILEQIKEINENIKNKIKESENKIYLKTFIDKLKEEKLKKEKQKKEIMHEYKIYPSEETKAKLKDINELILFIDKNIKSLQI